MEKLVATKSIAMQAQQLAALTTGPEHATSHVVLSTISIAQASLHIFTPNSPLLIVLNIMCTNLTRAYIFFKQAWM